MCLGNGCIENNQFAGLKWTESIKILGIHFTYINSLSNRLNFEEKLAEANKVFNLWRSRNLTLYGRITLAKSFILSKFLYVSAALVVPVDIIKKVNSMIFKFIWNGKPEKIKRNVLIREFEEGGLKAPDFEVMITAASYKWFKACVENDDKLWNVLSKYYMDKANIRLALICNCNFNTKTLNLKNVPEFYIHILNAIGEIYECKGQKRIMRKNAMEEIIWYNENICIQGRSIFFENFFHLGIVHISDLFDNEGIIPFDEWMQDLDACDFLKWRGIIHSVMQYRRLYPERFTDVEIIEDDIVFDEQITTNFIYKLLIQRKANYICNIPKIAKQVVLQDDVDWSRIYGLTFKFVKDARSRIFQYKLLNDILPVNYWLHKWKISDPLCSFGCEEIETISHLLWDCNVVQNVVHHFKTWWKDHVGNVSNISKEILLLGDIHGTELENICLLDLKRYIFNCKCSGGKPNLCNYIKFLTSRCIIEWDIAKRSFKTTKFIERWGEMVYLLE